MAASDEFDYDVFTIGAGSGGVRASRMASSHGEVQIPITAEQPMQCRQRCGSGGQCSRMPQPLRIQPDLGSLAVVLQELPCLPSQAAVVPFPSGGGSSSSLMLPATAQPGVNSSHLAPRPLQALRWRCSLCGQREVWCWGGALQPL